MLARGRKGKQNEDLRKRRALIVAISNYDNKSCFPNLPNVFEDGYNLCKVLSDMEWEVSLKPDLSNAAIRDAVADFLVSEKDEEACLFCFIGHGIEVNGNHYLVPKDARLEDVHRNATDFESDVKESCRALEFVQDRFARKRSGRCPTAFLLDCCRSCDFQTPPQENAVDGSLPSAAIVSAPAPKTKLKNSCVIYSTTAGHKALDGIRGMGGPFMNLFTEEIRAGGDLVQILTRTRTKLNERQGQLAPLEDMLHESFRFHPNTSSGTSLRRSQDEMAVCDSAGTALLPGGEMEDAVLNDYDANSLFPLPFIFVGANATLTSDYIQDVTGGWESYRALNATMQSVILGGIWHGMQGCGATMMELMPSIFHLDVPSDEVSDDLLFNDGRVSYAKLRGALESIHVAGGRVRLAVLMASNSGSEERAGTLIKYADCIVAVNGECNDQSRTFVKNLYTFLQRGTTLDASWRKSSTVTPDDHHVVMLSSQPQEVGKLKFQECPKPVFDMCKKLKNTSLDDADFSGAETASLSGSESEESENRAAIFLYNPTGTLASYAEDIDNLFQSHRRSNMSFCGLLLFLLVTDGTSFGFCLGNCPERWEAWKEEYKDAAASGQALETDIRDGFEGAAEGSGATMKGVREEACQCKKKHVRCIQVIDALVRNAIAQDFELEEDEWNHVVDDWFRSEENSEFFFGRANGYLTKRVFDLTGEGRICGVRVLLTLEMGSYGVFMGMKRFSLSLLLSMLEVERHVGRATENSRPAGGFTVVISSNRRVFSLRDGKLPLAKEQSVIVAGLRCMAAMRDGDLEITLAWYRLGGNIHDQETLPLQLKVENGGVKDGEVEQRDVEDDAEEMNDPWRAVRQFKNTAELPTEDDDLESVASTMRIITLRATRDGRQAEPEDVVECMRQYADDAAIQEDACSSLCRMMEGNVENQDKAIDASCIEQIMVAVRQHPGKASMQEAAFKALINIAWAHPENQATALAAGSIALVLSSMHLHQANERVQEHAAWVLQCIAAGNTSTQNQAGESGVMGQIVTSMQAHEQHVGVQEAACGALRSLTSNHMENKGRAGTAGAVERIVVSMREHLQHAGAQEAACGALWSLTVNHSENRVRANATGVFVQVVKAMDVHVLHDEVQFQACGALRNLMADSVSNKRVAAAAGAVEQVLVSMQVHVGHAEVQEQGCAALRSLTSGVSHNKGRAGVKGIEAVLEAMRGHPESAGVQEQGCRALWSLAVNAVNTVKIAGMGGIEAVLEAMRGHPESAEVQEAGCGALWSLAVNAVIAVKIASMGGLEAALEAMRGHPESEEVQKEGCGVLRSLAVNAEKEVKVAGMGGVEAVLKAMWGHPESAGVQEAGCGALLNLAAMDDTGIKIAGMGGLEAVLEAMRGHPESEGVQVEGCGALSNLAVTADNGIKIAGMGGVERLLEAMRQFEDDSAGVQEAGRRALRNLAVNADEVKMASGSTIAVGLLLSARADPAARNENGQTALHLGVQRKDPTAIELLLDAGADADARDSNQQTPLHCAAAACFHQGVELLIRSGADVHAKDTKQRTPLQCILRDHDDPLAWSVKRALREAAGDNDPESALQCKAMAEVAAYVSTAIGLAATGWAVMTRRGSARTEAEANKLKAELARRELEMKRAMERKKADAEESMKRQSQRCEEEVKAELSRLAKVHEAEQEQRRKEMEAELQKKHEEYHRTTEQEKAEWERKQQEQQRAFESRIKKIEEKEESERKAEQERIRAEHEKMLAEMEEKRKADEAVEKAAWERQMQEQQKAFDEKIRKAEEQEEKDRKAQIERIRAEHDENIRSIEASKRAEEAKLKEQFDALRKDMEERAAAERAAREQIEQMEMQRREEREACEREIAKFQAQLAESMQAAKDAGDPNKFKEQQQQIFEVFLTKIPKLSFTAPLPAEFADKKTVLFLGDVSTGKTTLIKHLFNEYRGEYVVGVGHATTELQPVAFKDMTVVFDSPGQNNDAWFIYSPDCLQALHQMEVIAVTYITSLRTVRNLLQIAKAVCASRGARVITVRTKIDLFKEAETSLEAEMARDKATLEELGMGDVTMFATSVESVLPDAVKGKCDNDKLLQVLLAPPRSATLPGEHPPGPPPPPAPPAESANPPASKLEEQAVQTQLLAELKVHNNRPRAAPGTPPANAPRTSTARPGSGADATSTGEQPGQLNRGQADLAPPDARRPTPLASGRPPPPRGAEPAGGMSEELALKLKRREEKLKASAEDAGSPTVGAQDTVEGARHGEARPVAPPPRRSPEPPRQAEPVENELQKMLNRRRQWEDPGV